MKRLFVVLCLSACSKAPREGVLIEAVAARVFSTGMGTASFEVQNLSALDDRLSSVECTAAEEVRFHVTEFTGDDVAKMTESPDGFVVRASDKLRLHPAGPHLMLYGVKLPAGARVLPLRLHFDRAGTIEVAAPLRSQPSP